MNATLARTDLALHVRQTLYFALGKAHDDMRDYEAAMRNFEAGNRLEPNAPASTSIGSPGTSTG